MKTFRYVNDLPPIPELKTEEIDGVRYYNTPVGSFPSVTSVLGYFKQESLREWRTRVGYEEANRISQRAASRGTRVHNLIEKYLRNQENILENVMPDLQQTFRDAQLTLDNIDNIHYIEASLYSKQLGLAGRADTIGEYDGTLSVIDFKTSIRAKRETHIRNYFEQATAYAMMYEELVNTPIDQIVIIIMADDSMTPQVFVRDKYDYIGSLMEKIDTYHLQKEELCF